MQESDEKKMTNQNAIGKAQVMAQRLHSQSRTVHEPEISVPLDKAHGHACDWCGKREKTNLRICSVCRRNSIQQFLREVRGKA